MAWYTAGTVKVAANNATVTGTGTKWLSGARQGEAFVAPDGQLYEVKNIASDTSLTLTQVYRGASASGQAYALAPMQGYVKELADRVASLLLLSQTEWEWDSVLKKTDLQAAPNDPTAWKILTNGRAFGLGSFGAANSYDHWPTASLDDVDVPAGMYYVSTAITDRPTTAPGVVWHRQTGTVGAQIYVSSDGGLLHRGRRSGTYRAWLTTLNVGEFGLGGATTTPANGRDSSNPFGWYYQTRAVTWGGGSFFLDMPYGSNMNAGLRLSTDPYSDNFYLNGGVSGKREYRPACKLVHDKNIVGDVAGGSVVQSGSNSNGNWIRLANGTQICRGQVTFSGNGWKPSSPVISYPMAFTAPPTTVIQPLSDGSGYYAVPQMGMGSGSGSFFIRDTAGIVDTGTSAAVDYVAIGVWK